MISKIIQILLGTGMVFILLPWSSSAQEPFNYPLIEHEYLPNIKSSKLYNLDVQKERPIWVLNENQKLQKLYLIFDDLDADTKYYEFSILHCTSDWQQSDLDITEYSRGYLRTEIEEFQFSIQTKQSYTTYSYVFDIDNIPWYKSGNYLLIVWDVTDDDKVAFTKRLFVLDDKVPLKVNTTLPLRPGVQRRNQAFEVTVDLEDFKIFKPEKELLLSVYQNMRWDNPLLNMTFFNRLGHIFEFGRPDEISFPGLKEFRSLDIRSARYRSIDIEVIERTDEHIWMLHEIDYPRTYQEYLYERDRNGTFFFINNDREIQGELRTEYINVLFTLKMKELNDQEVYWTGPHIGWELLPEYRMRYDNNREAYFLETLLKQGYYDYTYVLKDMETHKIDITGLEGSTYKADNDYIFMFYYRDRGERYDQLIGISYYSFLGGPLTLFDYK